MTTAVKWRTAFKEIYGRTPTKTDYKIAPQRVKEECQAECSPRPCVAEDSLLRRGEVRLKRPNAEAEEISFKKRRPAKARCLRGPTLEPRTSPRISMVGQPDGNAMSPVKLCSKSGSRCTVSTPSTEVQLSSKADLLSSNMLRSPDKHALSPCVYSSLFDTPEKGENAAWARASVKKESLSTTDLPFRSPRKPVPHKEVLVKSTEYLLLPTPEKVDGKKELEPFVSEEVTQKHPSKTCKKGLAVSFLAQKDKIVKKVFKRSSAGIVKSKTAKGNYVRINLKKKSYAKGKVSAEQKRKMRRKQNWKKRIGSGPGG